MNKFFLCPICLIQVKCIFADQTINCHKTFVVTSFDTTFISCITSKIKHIPYMCCPKPRTFLNDFRHMLMVHCLKFFAVISAFWIIIMICCNSFASIFRNSDRSFWVHLMERIQPCLIIFQLSAIPSEIMVITYHIGNVILLIFHRKVGHLSHRCHPCIIQFMDKRM